MPRDYRFQTGQCRNRSTASCRPECCACGRDERSAVSRKPHGNPSAPDWLGPIIFSLVFRKVPENKKLAGHLRSSAGVAVFVADEESPPGWIAVGRSFERFALQATALGIRHAHENMPIEVPAVRPVLADWLGLPGRRPDLVVRFGRASPMPMSLRRPLDNVIDTSGS